MALYHHHEAAKSAATILTAREAGLPRSLMRGQTSWARRREAAMHSIEQLRLRVQEAERHAAEASNGVEREACLRIAKGWRDLLERAERWGPADRDLAGE